MIVMPADVTSPGSIVGPGASWPHRQPVQSWWLEDAPRSLRARQRRLLGLAERDAVEAPRMAGPLRAGGRACAGRGGAPAWVLVPDKVGDRQATIELWEAWAPRVRAWYGWPLAFAVQDGMIARDVPSAAQVVFVAARPAGSGRPSTLVCGLPPGACGAGQLPPGRLALLPGGGGVDRRDGLDAHRPAAGGPGADSSWRSTRASIRGTSGCCYGTDLPGRPGGPGPGAAGGGPDLARRGRAPGCPLGSAQDGLQPPVAAAAGERALRLPRMRLPLGQPGGAPDLPETWPLTPGGNCPKFVGSGQ